MTICLQELDGINMDNEECAGNEKLKEMSRKQKELNDKRVG